MKRAAIVARRSSAHQSAWGGAFAEGLSRHGFAVTISEGAIAADLMVLWSTRNAAAIEMQKQSGGEVCILERGYVGDRFKWTSVSFGGGLNGRGVFRGPLHDASRWTKHFADRLQPWRQRDGYALLIGQVPGDMSIRNVKIDSWYRGTARQLAAAGWTVRFRVHPGALERGYQPCKIDDARLIGGTLEEALAGAAPVVTFNSNTGVESVLAGCPTITMDEGAMAWPVTGHSVDEVMTPDREAWAAALAWKQWTLEEMASGECWAHVGQG